MRKKRELLSRLLNRKRVQITPENYLMRVNSSLLGFFVLTLLFSFYVLVNFRLSFLTISIALGVTIIVGGSILFLKQKINSTIIKGDTLILNSFNNSSKVTSLRSIKRIKTKTVLGMQWTNINYSLDGRIQSAVIVNRSSVVPFTPENTIREAIKLSEKTKGKS